MSQDNTNCALCDGECGYDDEKGYWFGQKKSSNVHTELCSSCREKLVSRFCAFFGVDDVSWDVYGLEVKWHEIDKMLSNIKRDYAMRISYITTDKELYERTEKVKVPIL